MELEERSYGACTVYFGDKNGKYPHGNTLVVRGPEESVVIDPSLGMVARAPEVPRVDRLLNSHCHEDHVAGNYLYEDLPWHLHEADIVGMQSLDHMMEIYGYPEPIHSTFKQAVVDDFNYRPKPDAIAYRDGDVFELGGDVRVRVIHAPGHTRGHCLLHVEPDDLVYLADIDLSSFGPYYGDAWSDLDEFEKTLEQVRKIDAAYYATFHHVGVLEGREAYLERLDRFCAVIPAREQRLLEYLTEPHTLEEIVQTRFIYPAHAASVFVDAVERTSMQRHLLRMEQDGRIRKEGEGWVAA